MPDLYLLFNHKLTKQQESEVKNKFNINRIHYLSKTLQNKWSTITPFSEFPNDAITKIIQWLDESSVSDDYVLVQGEYGATFYIVDYCFNKGLIPIYATSKRIYEEKKLENGDIIRQHTFRHVRFRKYRRYKDE